MKQRDSQTDLKRVYWRAKKKVPMLAEKTATTMVLTTERGLALPTELTLEFQMAFGWGMLKVSLMGAKMVQK